MCDMGVDKLEMQELMVEILLRMQKKYKGLLEIERVTKELEELLALGDKESVQLLLTMREEEIELTHAEDNSLRELLNVLDYDVRTYVTTIMNGEKESFPSGSLEEKIYNLGSQTRNLCQKTCEIDRVLSVKIAGKDSYYNS